MVNRRKKTLPESLQSAKYESDDVTRRDVTFEASSDVTPLQIWHVDPDCVDVDSHSFCFSADSLSCSKFHPVNCATVVSVFDQSSCQ